MISKIRQWWSHITNSHLYTGTSDLEGLECNVLHRDDRCKISCSAWRLHQQKYNVLEELIGQLCHCCHFWDSTICMYNWSYKTTRHINWYRVIVFKLMKYYGTSSNMIHTIITSIKLQSYEKIHVLRCTLASKKNCNQKYWTPQENRFNNSITLIGIFLQTLPLQQQSQHSKQRNIFFRLNQWNFGHLLNDE